MGRREGADTVFEFVDEIVFATGHNSYDIIVNIVQRHSITVTSF